MLVTNVGMLISSVPPVMGSVLSSAVVTIPVDFHALHVDQTVTAWLVVESRHAVNQLSHYKPVQMHLL